MDLATRYKALTKEATSSITSTTKSDAFRKYKTAKPAVAKPSPSPTTSFLTKQPKGRVATLQAVTASKNTMASNTPTTTKRQKFISRKQATRFRRFIGKCS